MSQQNPIGLAELIEQVKQELLSTGPDAGAIPFFSVDEVTLELQVTVRKEGKGGLQIHVIELGGSVGRDDVQTIKVTLTPLVSKEDRIRLYEQHYSGGAEAVKRVSMGALKGSLQESQRDTFGG